MCDDIIHQGLVEDTGLSRRAFGLGVAAAAGVAGVAGAAGAATNVVERDVAIRTPDGTCDAVIFHPAGMGRHSAVLIWPDIMGLRPAFRDMGRRLAAAGHVVLVPNPFYRSRQAPVVEGAFDFTDPEARKVLFGYRAAMTPEGVARDAAAYIAFLDAQPQTDLKKKAGVQGYCMGGALSFQSAAAVPARIAAVGSFHGGNGLVTDKPDSPHLLIPKTEAAFLVAQARNDDAQASGMKDQLKAAFGAAKRPATVEVYPADHGWCVPGGKTYDAAQAERAWAELAKLYRARLA